MRRILQRLCAGILCPNGVHSWGLLSFEETIDCKWHKKCQWCGLEYTANINLATWNIDWVLTEEENKRDARL